MENEKIWESILGAIEQNRIVPIIGDEFFYVETENGQVNYSQYILDTLIDKFKAPQEISPDFNVVADMITLNNLKQRMMGTFTNATDIYYEIGEIVKNTPIVCDECVKDFLSTFKFPLILTTSYIPGLEKILGDTIVVRAYDKTPRIDIPIPVTSQNTTLYYLFGKCSKANKTYMVTEDDLLDYMHYWHNIETRPRNLSDYLSDKFMLLLGCNYPNWLFRFFWHSIKNFNLLSGKEGVKGIVAGAMIDSDNDLYRFLSRIQTHAYANAKKLMEELIERQRNDTASNNSVNKLQQMESYDIFMSYNHKDLEVVKKIVDILEKNGAKVWFDSTALIGSDYYDDIINNIISSAKRFVPILSHVTTSETRGYFRKEWSFSLDELRYRLGSPYIAPICIDEVDLTSQLIPKEFKDVHILNYNSPSFETDIKKLIRSFR